MQIATLKSYWLPIVVSIVGWGCGIAYVVIGSRIDKHDVLIEPFALIPLFYLCQLTAIFIALILAAWRAMKRRPSAR